ncbi:unnamed protein product [Brassica oleracea var. botrytis]|uniref:Extensin domain-containing protein n=2 Tax=Brassica TaxID=3705 RepID=A0A3P6DUE5_BRAOL|nr:unnamed protein product [Brassica napus]CDY09503.1 BnaC02g20450D [Brassica napus]VDD22719.1 unnamed protein product [Brassica oleracea]
MPETPSRSNSLVVTIITAIALLTFPMMTNSLDSQATRKLEEEPIKCTPGLQIPPPSPPPPSPSCPPPPPPPSPQKKSYCPPPPSTYIYLTGPPGELYPVDQQFGEAAAKSFRAVKISGLIAFGVMETPCAYPCYPPPIGGGGSTQPAGYYPQPTAYYPPPGYIYPPPTTNVPDYPSPPDDGGDYGGGYYGPPPPDPILPYFPFYYRKPPHQTDQSSSASAKSTVKIVTMANIFAVLVVLINLNNRNVTS